jgi:hypothetical protein
MPNIAKIINNNNSISSNDKTINLKKSFNLTNNTKDSVYLRVDAFENDVYEYGAKNLMDKRII